MNTVSGSTYMLTWLELVAKGKVRRISRIPAHTCRALLKRGWIGSNHHTPGSPPFVTQLGRLFLAGADAQRRRMEDGDE